jgi:hypothetical protein
MSTVSLSNKIIIQLINFITKEAQNTEKKLSEVPARPKMGNLTIHPYWAKVYKPRILKLRKKNNCGWICERENMSHLLSGRNSGEMSQKKSQK